MSDSAANMERALATLQGRIGQSSPPTDWFEITQARINDFADVTMDHQWIHIDVERSKAGPFGAPIAHGQLTLSIMGHLPRTEPVPGGALEGQKLGINYGSTRSASPHPSRSEPKSGQRAR